MLLNSIIPEFLVSFMLEFPPKNSMHPKFHKSFVSQLIEFIIGITTVYALCKQRFKCTDTKLQCVDSWLIERLSMYKYFTVNIQVPLSHKMQYSNMGPNQIHRPQLLQFSSMYKILYCTHMGPIQSQNEILRREASFRNSEKNCRPTQIHSYQDAHQCINYKYYNIHIWVHLVTKCNTRA